MLLLPRIEDFAQPVSPGFKPQNSSSGFRYKERQSPLKACFHLYSSIGTELTEIESVKQQRLTRSRDIAEQETPDTSLSPRRINTAPLGEAHRQKQRRKKSKDLAPLKDARSTQRFNGINSANLSQAGNWLDSRAFCETDEKKGTPRSARRQGKRILTEPQKFVMKRCKDTLIRRFHSIDAAFKKLASDRATVTIMDAREFTSATAAVFSKSEAGILFRLLDSNHDVGLTIDELHTMLDEI